MFYTGLKYSFWVFCSKQSRQIGRGKYQRERNPRSQQAGKHFQASVNQDRHKKEIYDNYKTFKDYRSSQWCRVIELLEINQRYNSKEYWGANRMDH